MPVLDLAVILAYIVGTVAFGAWVSRTQQNVTRSIPPAGTCSGPASSAAPS
jgi:hypothetical protein